MAYIITDEFIDKLDMYCYKYYEKYDALFSLDVIGYGGLLSEFHNKTITKIGNNLLDKIAISLLDLDRKNAKANLIINDLKNSLILDVDDTIEEEKKEKYANMTYALSKTFAIKLKNIRVIARCRGEYLSESIGRSKSYISHLEKRVIQSLDKNDFYNLTICLTLALHNNENFHCQNDVINYFLPYMAENPEKLRCGADAFFQSDNEPQIDPRFKNIYDAICELIKSKNTTEEQEIMAKKLLRNLVYPDHEFIAKIFTQSYTDFASGEARENFIEELNCLVEKYSI